MQQSMCHSFGMQNYAPSYDCRCNLGSDLNTGPMTCLQVKLSTLPEKSNAEMLNGGLREAKGQGANQERSRKLSPESGETQGVEAEGGASEHIQSAFPLIIYHLFNMLVCQLSH